MSLQRLGDGFDLVFYPYHREIVLFIFVPLYCFIQSRELDRTGDDTQPIERADEASKARMQCCDAIGTDQHARQKRETWSNDFTSALLVVMACMRSKTSFTGSTRLSASGVGTMALPT
ncbi:hypothetical protein [Paraburkholderia bannensis]|uniref:hypothetical protein n=1 Tax=Paraburkholderia bannensis TaxID=765414 RepID=UPI002AB5DE3D|nr:hypothetical protein [Paraburkholderia bannensis]